MAEVTSVNDHMLVITLPIPLSAQDPENFNIKKAIIESPVVQGFYKVMSLEETMNLWYMIRAALAKPSSPLLPPHAAIATVSNGKHFTTFDGRTFSLSVSGRLLVTLQYRLCMHFYVACWLLISLEGQDTWTFKFWAYSNHFFTVLSPKLLVS